MAQLSQMSQEEIVQHLIKTRDIFDKVEPLFIDYINTMYNDEMTHKEQLARLYCSSFLMVLPENVHQDKILNYALHYIDNDIDFQYGITNAYKSKTKEEMHQWLLDKYIKKIV